MAKDNKQIKELIDEGLSTISKMKIWSNTPAGPNTNKLKEIVKNLYPLISDDYPQTPSMRFFVLLPCVF